MAQSRDWWPRNRGDQLSFVQNWVSYMREPVDKEEPESLQRFAAWGIPAETYTAFVIAFDTARSALQRATNEETRTKPATAACNEAFDNLEFLARDLKRRFFHTPPLSKADIAALNLKEPAWGSGPLGDPTAEIHAVPSIKGMGYHQMRIDLAAVSGDLSARNNQGHYHTKYGVFSPESAPPKSYKDLREDIYSDRKKEVINFEPEDSGKTAYFCGRIEQGDRKGPWGPVTGGKIP